MKNLILMIALVIIPLCGCSKKADESAGKSGSEQELENFTVYETDKGIKLWDLTASRAKISDATKLATLANFKVNFYNRERKVTSILSAERGRIDTQNNDFFTEGNTLVKTPDGESLSCENLQYTKATKMISTESKVRIERKDSVITGTGMEATPDLSVVKVKNNRVIAQK